MTAASDVNQKIIDEFRGNGGCLSGPFEGVPVLLLHHVGAKSGVPRINPMMYQPVGGAWAVFATAVGADRNPDWYHNLLAYSEAEIEVGKETIPVRARDLDRKEREPIWQTQKDRYPGFADYEHRTAGIIPVVLLERR